MRKILCGRLIDGRGNPPRERVLLHVDEAGKITDITPADAFSGQEPDVLDYSQYTVMPGLVDCHDHLGLDLGDEEAQARETDGETTVKSLYNARVMVAKGITLIRDVGQKGHIDAPIAAALNSGQFPGPHVVHCGELICRTGGHGWYSGRQADGEADVRRAVREQLKHGADFIKFMATGGVSTLGSSPTIQEFTDAEIRALIDEAHRAGRKVASHLYGGPALRVAVEAGLDSVEHGALLNKEDVALMAEKGTVLTVTYGVYEVALESPATPEFWKEKMSAIVAQYDKVIAWAHELGVQVAVGGDGVHGRTVLEVKALVRNGFTPLEALRAATLNGAELCGLGGRKGSLEVGKDADLIALEGNPLEDLAAVDRVRAVLRQGRPVSIEPSEVAL